MLQQTVLTPPSRTLLFPERSGRHVESPSPKRPPAWGVFIDAHRVVCWHPNSVPTTTRTEAA